MKKYNKLNKKINEYISRHFNGFPIKAYHSVRRGSISDVFYDGYLDPKAKHLGECQYNVIWFTIADDYNTGYRFSFEIDEATFNGMKFEWVNDNHLVTPCKIDIMDSRLRMELINNISLDALYKNSHNDLNCFFERTREISDGDLDSETFINKMLQQYNIPRSEWYGEEELNEVDAKDVNLSSFKVKKELNQKFWPNGKLNSRVRLRLMDIADDFIKELSVDWVKPKDVIFTGSLANYNWSSYSDIDLHILIDFNKVYSKNSDFVDDYFKSKKENWLTVHEDLKIFGFPIEISVEDSNEDNPSSGRYSLYKNKWIVEPDDFQDALINQEYVKKRAAKIMSQIDDIEEKFNNETDTHKCETYGNKAYKIFDKLKNMRSEGLSSEKKEMSSGNIIYKIIRRTGYLDKIWEIVNSSYDKANSIKENKIIAEAQNRGEHFSAGIIPFRMNKQGKTEVFLGFPGQPKNKRFNPPYWMNRWQIMKGHMENGEDPKECAIREFCEESGVSPKLISHNQLINLGSEQMHQGRKLVCYGLDLTDNTNFDSIKFHSNMIDSPHYIQINGGKAYPEIEKYGWKEVDNVGGSSSYETAFYQKCDKICKSRYADNDKQKTIIISDEQRELVKETLNY